MNEIRNTPKKLIAIDLDGTLLDSGKHISERTHKALQRAFPAGLEPVIVTGRPLSGLPRELELLPQIRYVITSNGAVTTDLHTGRVLRSCLIPAQTALEIARIPDERTWIYSVFLDGIGYCSGYVYRKLRGHYDGTPLDSYVQRSRRPEENMEERIRASEGAENIWIVCEDPEQAQRLSRYIEQRWMLQIFRTAPSDVETGAPGADKGQALKALYEMLRLRKEDVYAIGDNHNDLSMLQAAGTAVAMGNATEEIRAAADRVTETNDRDGVADVIESLL